MRSVAVVLMAAVLAAAGQAVVVENFSFELPGTGKIANNWGLIPGWSSDVAPSDSGVESAWPGSTEGVYSGYLMAADPSVWNLTGHVIAAGEVFTLQVDARNNWTDGGLADFVISLYYDVAGVRNVVASATFLNIPDDWTTYSLTFSANDVAASIGYQIGIELNNVESGASWLGIDNVRLDVVPEPATMLLLGVGGLLASRCRKSN